MEAGMDASSLNGEIAVVTGADSGIGQATALAFAKEGADVAISYLHDSDGAARTRQGIESAGRRAYLAQLDVRDPDAVERFFRDARQALGTPTILVNNAGIGGGDSHVRDMSPEQWDDVIRTNLYGPFYTCRQFILGLDGSDRHGTIINITSVHQEIPMPGAAAYDASKGGLRNLTATLALELAQRNINVNNIAPGMVLTPMNQAALDDARALERQVQPIPMKRAAQPQEIADVAVFLASARARYIHGSTIFVDGGLMLNLGQGA
jgi:glucose 1-dehydrogenase